MRVLKSMTLFVLIVAVGAVQMEKKSENTSVGQKQNLHKTSRGSAFEPYWVWFNTQNHGRGPYGALDHGSTEKEVIVEKMQEKQDVKVLFGMKDLSVPQGEVTLAQAEKQIVQNEPSEKLARRFECEELMAKIAEEEKTDRKLRKRDSKYVLKHKHQKGHFSRAQFKKPKNVKADVINEYNRLRQQYGNLQRKLEAISYVEKFQRQQKDAGKKLTKEDSVNWVQLQKDAGSKVKTYFSYHWSWPSNKLLQLKKKTVKGLHDVIEALRRISTECVLVPQTIYPSTEERKSATEEQQE